VTNQDRFSIISTSVQLRISFGLTLIITARVQPQIGIGSASYNLWFSFGSASAQHRISFGSALDNLLSSQPSFGNKSGSVQLRITFGSGWDQLRFSFYRISSGSVTN
jgi:hypothetical protein